MRLRTFRILGLLFILVVAISCTRGPDVPDKSIIDETQELKILIVAGTTEHYPLVQLLTDEKIRADLGARLGRELQVRRITGSPEAHFLGTDTFWDLLLVDDPLYMAVLAEGGRLKLLPTSERWEGYFGRYRGKQYAQVFESETIGALEPIVLVLPQLLQEAGITEVDYTPEGVEALLQELDPYVSTPMMVYGIPTKGGFSLLQGLFRVAPEGGREFFLDGETVVYDKVSERGRSYLAYLNKLYSAGLLPTDFLNFTQYSAVDVVATGRTAIAVFNDPGVVRMAMKGAQANGIEVARIPLPVEKELLEERITRVLLAMVSQKTTDPAVFELLSLMKEMENSAGRVNEELDIPLYPLFITTGPAETIYDPVEQVRYNTWLHQEKRQADTTLIEPYYSRIAIGDLGISAFSEMVAQWIIEPDMNTTVVDTLAARFMRRFLSESTKGLLK